MKLVWKDGGSYEVTPSDRSWLLRAVEAEGPVSTQVARALVNRFALLRSRGDKRTLGEFVRAYAQPVNPRWFPDGDLFRKQGVPSASELAQAQKRETVHSARLTFSAETEAAVDEALSTPFPSDVTDYAAPDLDASKKGMLARSDKRAGVNRLWTSAPDWAGYAVDGAAGTGSAIVALLALALALYLMRGKS